MNRCVGLVALFFLFVSCSNGYVYSEFRSIPSSKWISPIEFTIANGDTLSQNNVYINIRNTKDYNFSNLFLITEMKFPDGVRVVDTLEYEMADSSGRFLGTGYTDIKENLLFYKQRVIFDQQGDYTFKIEQAMREMGEVKGLFPLNGVSDVGLSIEKISK